MLAEPYHYAMMLLEDLTETAHFSGFACGKNKKKNLTQTLCFT